MPISVQAIGAQRASGHNSRALSSLSHAIEYLSERYVQSDGTAADQNGLMQALNLLMSLHADLYKESTEKVTDTVRVPFWSRLLVG